MFFFSFIGPRLGPAHRHIFDVDQNVSTTVDA